MRKIAILFLGTLLIGGSTVWFSQSTVAQEQTQLPSHIANEPDLEAEFIPALVAAAVAVGWVAAPYVVSALKGVAAGAGAVVGKEAAEAVLRGDKREVDAIIRPLQASALD